MKWPRLALCLSRLRNLPCIKMELVPCTCTRMYRKNQLKYLLHYDYFEPNLKYPTCDVELYISFDLFYR
jgi:hypothetical protein